jgi:hypothetical protein
MALLMDQVKEHRNHIKHEAITFSLSELVNMYCAEPKEIEIRPDFQRLFRWTREQQCSFIESLILEMPIPPLFFFENDDGRWDLLDGLQRLSTVIKFLGAKNEVPANAQGIANNEDDWHYQTENDINEPLQLLAGEYLTELSGLTFSKLPIQLQLNLKRVRLYIYVMKRETKPIYKYEVFKRLNKGGSILEDQELRNCNVRLLGTTFADFIQEISKNKDFVSSIGLDTLYTQNGYLDELALRFFTMKNYGASFKHDVSIFMTKYMEEVTKNTISFNYSSEKLLFEKTWRCINNALPDGEAFRGKTPSRQSTGPFAPTLFEIVTLGIADNIGKLESVPSLKLKEIIIDLIMHAKREGLTGGGSNSKAKTLARLDFGKTWLRAKVS